MRPQSNMNLAPLPHVKHEFGATGQHQIGAQKIEHQFGAPPPLSVKIMASTFSFLLHCAQAHFGK